MSPAPPPGLGDLRRALDALPPAPAGAPPRSVFPLPHLAAAGLVLLAGIIHLVVLQQHLQEALGLGLYFCAIGAAQVLWPVVYLVRPTRRLAVTGITALAVGPIVLWVLTRTLRAPWSDGPEPVDVVSVLSLLAEAAAFVLLLAALPVRGSNQMRPARAATTAVLLVAGILVGGATYGAALAAEATVPALGEPVAGHHADAHATPEAPEEGHAHSPAAPG